MCFAEDRACDTYIVMPTYYIYVYVYVYVYVYIYICVCVSVVIKLLCVISPKSSNANLFAVTPEEIAQS